MLLTNRRYHDYSAAMARGIRADIKQKKPLPSLEAEAFLSLQRTADHLQGQLTEVLKAYEISPTQYNALRILRGAGEAGLPCGEIGERMIQRDPDITRLLDRLQGRGLVARSRGKEDRRVLRARITAAGLVLLRGLDGPVEEFHQRSLGHMGDGRLRSLVRMLDAARQGDYHGGIYRARKTRSGVEEESYYHRGHRGAREDLRAGRWAAAKERFL